MERVGADGRIDTSEIRPASAMWNGFTYFRKDDVLVAKITPCFENGKGACLESLPTSIGFGSTEFIVLRARRSIMPQFLYRLTTASEFRALGADAMTGATGQQRVPTDFVSNYVGAVPPPTEQSAIVRFLDHADRRIRRYIRAKQKLIKLLEEQKQAIIHRAVTRGLGPNVRLKPSGVEWLGDVPGHWDVRPAKRHYREIDERSESGMEEQLSVSHLTGVTARSQKNITMFMAESYTGHKLCQVSDLVINTMWAWMGALGVARVSGLVSPSYGVYRLLASSELIPAFGDLLLSSQSYTAEYNCRSTGIHSSRLRLYPDQFLRIPLVCPPPTEQHAILQHIARITKELNGAQRSASREIELLREYRTRLIADLVTGKLDVRAAAAALPDEVEAPESTEETHLLDEADVARAEENGDTELEYTEANVD